MDLWIGNRTGLIVADDAPLAEGCADALEHAGVVLARGADEPGTRWRRLPTDASRAGALVRDAIDELGQLDIVVLIAGAQFRNLDDSGGDDDTDELFAAWERVVGMAALYREALPSMKERRWGRLVLVQPIESKVLTERQGDFERMTGLGALGLSKSVADEIARFGITSNSVLWDAGLPQEILTTEVAATATYLASEYAGYLGGVAIAVDNGLSRGTF